MAARQPTGTVTMVFTDIEGSTLLLERLGTAAYREALEEHRRLVREACAANGGYEVNCEGDSFFLAFASAQAAVAAVADAMRRLADGPIRIRVGVHTGEPALDPPKYVGMDVHRAARIMDAGHGGQVLISAATAPLLDARSGRLRDLGPHRLKDLSAPVTLYQLEVEGLPTDFPPLRTLRHANLPVPATPFLGREHEIDDVVRRLVHQDTRLLTLTGPGGIGKTRLVLQAAAAAADHFTDGVTWVPLATVAEPSLVLEQVVRALGLQDEQGVAYPDQLRNALGGAQALVILDNVEQVIDGAREAATLLTSIEGPTVAMTSRERLRVRAEVVYEMPVLPADEAVELFRARAAEAGVVVAADAALEGLCADLDHLPLAIELAAARSALFSPAQLRARLTPSIDLLRGPVDADPRQQTLRATVEWSYRLLSADESRVFRGLSVFPGGCAYETAERVTGADPDVLESLIDKNLLRRRPDSNRYWMLVTIREFAAEQLSAAGEEPDVVRAAVAALVDVMADIERRAEIDGAALEEFDDDEPNVQHLVDAALRLDAAAEALQLAVEASQNHRDSGRSRRALAMLLRTLDAAQDAPVGVRARAFNALCINRHAVAEYDAARDAASEAFRLAVEAGRRDAELRALGNLGALSIELEEFDVSAEYLARAIELARELGDETELARASYNLAELTLYDDPAAAVEPLEAALEIVQRQGPQVGEILCLGRLGDARWLLGEPAEACRLLAASLRLAAESHHAFFAPDMLEALAGIAAARGERDVGRALVATAAALREQHGSGLTDRARAILDQTYASLGLAADGPSRDDAPSLERCIDLAEDLTRRAAADPGATAHAQHGGVG